MKQLPLLILTVLLAAGSSAAYTALAGDPRGTGSRAAEPDVTEPATELLERLDELEAENRRLEGQLSELATRGTATTRRSAGNDLDAAVERWMQSNAPRLAAGNAGTEDPGAAAAMAGGQDATEIQALAEAALSGDYGDEGFNSWWQRVREAGQLDAVIEELERTAELDAANPDTQSTLGHAYLQKVFDVGMGPVAMIWSDKANAAYDQALALDEEHWDARFSKAMTLSNMPAFLGKSSEAIHHFEVLIGQQEKREGRSQDAQSYYFLGNLYSQSGEIDKALEVWNRGLGRFPDSTQLQQQIEINGSK